MRNGVPLVVSRRRKLEESISHGSAFIRCERLLFCLLFNICGEWADRMNICSALTLVVTGRRYAF